MPRRLQSRVAPAPYRPSMLNASNVCDTLDVPAKTGFRIRSKTVHLLHIIVDPQPVLAVTSARFCSKRPRQSSRLRNPDRHSTGIVVPDGRLKPDGEPIAAGTGREIGMEVVSVSGGGNSALGLIPPTRFRLLSMFQSWRVHPRI